MLTIKAGFVVPMAVATVLAMSGCGDTNLDSTKQTVKTSTKASFAGRVVDVNGDAVSGVNVAVFANHKYTATTDSDGNYLVEINMGDVVASGGGGSGNSTSTSIGTPNEGYTTTLTRNFPIQVSKSGYATYRQVIDFEGNIGYTDGSGAVVLLSQVGANLPNTVLYPYAGNVSCTIYAGGAPAAGAVVSLTPPNTPSANSDNNTSDYSLEGNKTFVANANGVISITAADKVPAIGSYSVFVAPYDTNGDGQYEYDATSGSLNLSAKKGSGILEYVQDTAGNIVLTQTQNCAENLRDGSNDLTVVYSSIANSPNIPFAQAADFNIVVMFNRPIVDKTLAYVPNWGDLFSLRDGNNVPVPFSVTSEGDYKFTITPTKTLTPQGNRYNLKINDNNDVLVSANGGVNDSTQSYYFNIYDPDATVSTAAIVPGLDIDKHTNYRVDWNRFLIGNMTTDDPLADTTQGPSYPTETVTHNNDLRLSFAADPDAEDYHIWVKNSGSPWVNVEDMGINPSYTYNDGQTLEVTLPGIFAKDFLDTYPPTDLGGYFDGYVEPFFGDNMMQVLITSVNVNGDSMDPNSDDTLVGLTLADNWGPEVMNSGSSNFDSTASTQFNSGTYCDATGVNIAVSEPLLSATLTPEYGADEFGAKAVTGSPCFTVSGVRFPDMDLVDPSSDSPYPSNFSYFEVDLKPAVATTTTADAMAGDYLVSVADTTGFAGGDNVAVGDSNEYLYGMLGTTTLVVTPLGKDEASGSDAYWRGPVQNGYSDVTGTLPTNTSTYSQRLIVDDNTNVVANNSRISTGELVTATGAWGFDLDQLYLGTAPTAVIAPGAAVTGYNINVSGTCNTTLANAAAAGANTIDIVSGTDCADGDPIVIDFGDGAGGIELFTIASGGGTTTLTLSGNLANAHGIGETVDERTSWTATASAGWPLIYLGNTVEVKHGSTITFDNGTDTDTATVESVINGYVVLDGIPTASTSFDFIAGDSWTVDSSRGPDALQVKVQDRSDNDSSDTDTDGDGNANKDQIGYEEVDGAWDVF
jgi:hypothetical protein